MWTLIKYFFLGLTAISICAFVAMVLGVCLKAILEAIYG